MGKRILIADDSVTIQKAFAMTLVGEDFALTSARSADEGLTLARQTRPDVIIADAAMPGRSGYELCAALKADASLRAIPVYILSSTQRPYDDAKGQQVGADGNLTKPWDSGTLIEKLKEASGRPAGASPRPAGEAAVPAPRPTSTLPTAALGDYDVDMDAPRDTAPTATRSTVTSLPAVASPAPAARPGAPAGGMRPSLIPGIRPGAMPPVRPGTSPSRTLGGTTPLQAAVPPRPAAAAPQPMGRTLFGLPAASMPFPGSTRPAQPASAPGIAPAPRIEPSRPAPVPSPSPSIAGLVDQKVAAFAAKGPEYEALAKLSREVIEQIVWEIVPELAEAIIREQVAKRGVV